MSSQNIYKQSVPNDMIVPNDSVILLIDHQSGLFQLVKDIPEVELRSNVTGLARLASILNIPVFTTASVPEGPNGPLIPEIHQLAPHAQFIPRQGQINAWDMPDLVKAVEATGRKTLIVAGTLTSVCLAFPCISARAAGYRVYAVFDASGNWSTMATHLTIARLMHAGVIPIDTLAVISELQKTWNRPEARDFANLMADHPLPHYRLLIESFEKAQSLNQAGKAA